MNIYRIVAALACASSLAGCGKSHETISNQNTRGEISMSVDNGTGGGPKVVPPGTVEKVPPTVLHFREKAPSTGTGLVLAWNHLDVRTHAEQGKPPPGPGAKPAKVEVEVVATARSEFELKQRGGRDVDMEVLLHWTATLKDGRSMILVAGEITNPAAGTTPCSFAATYALATNAAKTRINVTSSGGGANFDMVNGGGSQDRHVFAPTCTLGRGNYQVRWLVSVVTQGDAMGDVRVDKAYLKLTKTSHFP